MRKLIVASVFVLALGSSRRRGQMDITPRRCSTSRPRSGWYRHTSDPRRMRRSPGGSRGRRAWQIDEAKSKLESNGDLDLEVKGLVLVSTGQNPLPSFKAIVSCLSIDSNGQAVTVNQLTDAFPATMPGGDAEFNGSVSLPSPCIAPIVFVTTAGTACWISVTGSKPRERGAARTGAPLPLRNRARLALRRSPSGARRAGRQRRCLLRPEPLLDRLGVVAERWPRRASSPGPRREPNQERAAVVGVR